MHMRVWHDLWNPYMFLYYMTHAGIAAQNLTQTSHIPLTAGTKERD